MSDRVYINPQFVSAALTGITHRFVLVLECETRHYGDPNKQTKFTPPRFSVGGPRANQDPRVVAVQQLLCITTNTNEIQIPSGWEKVHQYIYVKHTNTDDHGWQYRSDWSVGVLSPQDEQWVGVNADGRDVRRRLWMTTVVRRDDVIRAKRILSESLQKARTGVILQGELYKLEQGALSKSWQRRLVRLFHDSLEFYSGNEKKGDLAFQGCDVKMLFGSQCPGRDYAFSIRHPNGTVGVLLDADSKEIRRRWVVAIGYQIALNWPDVNFPPFDYGPPVGDEGNGRVLICGELQKRGHMVKNWKTRFFQLVPKELQYFEKESLKGKISIEEAVVEFDDRSLEFTVRAHSGATLIMRADSAATKATWVRAIQRQIQTIKDSKQGATSLSAKEIEEVKKANTELEKIEAEKALREAEEKHKRDAEEAAQRAKAEEEAEKLAESLKEVQVVTETVKEDPVVSETADTTTLDVSTTQETWVDEETSNVSTTQWQAETTEETAFSPETSAVQTSSSVNTSVEETVEVVEKVEDIEEEDDENDESFDPNLQFGGIYTVDEKNTDDFTYIYFDEYPKFTAEHRALLTKYLTPELFERLKDVKTSKGYSLSNVIQTGVLTPELSLGITAGDADSYEIFKDLFDPIIGEWHNVDIASFSHASDFDSSKLVITETQKSQFSEHIVSSSIYTSRNLVGFAFTAGTTSTERANTEEAVKSILVDLPGEFSGNYNDLHSISEVDREKLLSAGLLFEIPKSRSKLTSAGSARSWPSNRGLFRNEQSTAVVWVNEEDHIKIISQEAGGNISNAFSRFCSLVQAVNASAEAKGIEFSLSNRIGYLNTCPSNLGTALKVSVLVHLPEFNKLMQSRKRSEREILVRVCDAFGLQPAGSNGVLTAAEGDNFDISNTQRFRLTEVEAVQKLVDGVSKVIEVEKLLANGMSIETVNNFIENGFKSEPQPKLAPWAKKAQPSTPTAKYYVPKSEGVVPSRANLRPSRFAKTEEKDDDIQEDDFGMSSTVIDATIEARMNKRLLQAAKEKRSSFVLKQVAKHEKYFEQQGIDKNAPSLGNKKTYK
mmetsp:Transcript_23543/g.21418  ORF Transcript_23543/g.21418 Transcript_23543/m.21418 type:complete len:1061 (-) Transcript_23543:928-4110(-)